MAEPINYESNPLPLYPILNSNDYSVPAVVYDTPHTYYNPPAPSFLNPTYIYQPKPEKIRFYKKLNDSFSFLSRVLFKIAKAATITGVLTVVIGNPATALPMMGLAAVATTIDTLTIPLFLKLFDKNHYRNQHLNFKERMIKTMATLALTAVTAGPLLHIHLHYSVAKFILGSALRAYFSEEKARVPSAVVFF